MKRIILFICIITLIFTTQISATQTISNKPSKYNQSLHNAVYPSDIYKTKVVDSF